MRDPADVDLAADIPSGIRGSGLRVRRYWWLGALGFVAVVGAGVAYVLLGPKQYQATATVAVALPNSVTAVAKDALAAMDNELEYAQSYAVAAAATHQLSWPVTPTTALTELSAAVPTGSALITFTFTGSTAEQARLGANAFAHAYVQVRDASDDAESARLAKILSGQLAVDEAQLNAYSAEETRHRPTDPIRAEAATETTVLRNDANVLDGQLVTTQRSDPPIGAVTADAALPSKPSKPLPLIYLSVAVVAGLMVGLGLAAGAARLDRRIRVPADVEIWAGLLLLGELGRSRWGRRLVPKLLPSRADRVAVDRLRVRIWTASDPERARLLAVTSARQSGGVSLVVANLAAALARQGARVVVVCAAGPSPTAALLPPEVFPNVLVAGPDGSALSGAGPASVDAPWAQLARGWQEHVSAGAHVLVEAPPVRDGVDGIAVAHHVGRTILVAELGSTRIPDLRRSDQELTAVAAGLIGVVAVPRVRRWRTRQEPSSVPPSPEPVTAR
jgi:polysaccharide biosynthesis transport protein